METAHITPEHADEFAIGALDTEAARAVTLHTATCRHCASLVAQSRRVAAALTLGVPHHSPPPRLRRRVLRSAGILQPAPLRWAARIVAAGAGIAAVIIAIAALTGLVGVRSQVNQLRQDNVRLDVRLQEALAQKVEIAAITRELNAQQRGAADLRAAAGGDRDLLIALLSPESSIADVYTTDESASSVGRFIWDSGQKKVWFVASGLKELKDGQTYQLWVGTGGKFVSLGSFNAGASGLARFETLVPLGVEGYETAVVTIEPAPGAPTRSGPSVFVANLSALRR